MTAVDSECCLLDVDNSSDAVRAAAISRELRESVTRLRSSDTSSSAVSGAGTYFMTRTETYLMFKQHITAMNRPDNNT